MRVTFNSSFIQSRADLARTAERLADAQRQVSSGLRVHSPSDDPAAAAMGVTDRSELAAYNQYQRTADDADARLKVIDAVLSDIQDRLTNARTAILGARGSAVTDAQRQAAADELSAIRDALLSDFNTVFRGTYLFAGRAATTPPYTRLPNGVVTANPVDQTPVVVDIDRSTSVQVAYSADAIARGSDPGDIFAHLERAIAAVLAGNGAEMDAASSGLEAAFARASAAQSHVGSAMRVIEVHQGRLGALRRATDARIAALEGADLAKAITEMTQAETAQRAAFGAVSAAGRLSLMDYLR